MCMCLGGKQSVSCVTGNISKTEAMKSPGNHLKPRRGNEQECLQRRDKQLAFLFCFFVPNLFHASVHLNPDGLIKACLTERDHFKAGLRLSGID